MNGSVYALFAFVITTVLGAEGIEFRRVCYHTNWSKHVGNFQVQDIDPHLCTHIIYAFAKISIAENKLLQTEDGDDNGSNTDKQGDYFDFTGLKKRNPKLKTLLSVGGETMSASFPRMTITQSIMDIFAENSRIFLRDRNFDGLDIDWEFPMKESRDDFTRLLKTLRQTFDAEILKEGQSPLMLTIATAAGGHNIDSSYNMTEISKYVDFFNVMAYDYAGTWSANTGFGSPLYSRPSNTRLFNPTSSQNWTMHRYIELGAPKDKLVMGLRGAGASFTLQHRDNHGMGAPVIPGGGMPGSIRQLKGHLAYFEVCLDILDRGATVVWDEEQHNAYAYLDDQWVGYDDPRSITEKVHYAGSLGLGGVMFWAFDYDDFHGDKCNNGTYPLLTAIKIAADTYTINVTSTPSPRPDPITFPPLLTSRPSINDGTFKLYHENNGAVNRSSVLLIVAFVTFSFLCRYFKS